MPANSHSKGPWSTVPGQYTIWSSDDVKIATVADLPWNENPVTGHRSSDTLTELANARLIAAAPDLLAALRLIATTASLFAITLPKHAPGNDDLQAIVREARLAISKATNN